MGRRRSPRLILALVLLALALAAPLGTWFVSGWRNVQRQRSEIRAEADRARRRDEGLLEARLADRLTTLVTQESKRPYFHYQNLIHDPDSADLGASIVPSPLAEGPTDPLVATYFQIDPLQQLTVPTFNPDLPERNRDDVAAGATVALARLRPAASALEAVASAAAAPPEERPAPSTPRLATTTSPRAPCFLVCDTREARVELDNSSYVQNLDANRLYSTLKQNQVAPNLDATGNVTLWMWPLRYAVLSDEGGSATLYAVRAVDTPRGRLTQGFAVSEGALARFLPLPDGARLILDPGTASDPREGDVAIDFAQGGLRIELAPARPETFVAAEHVIASSFLWQFVPVAAFALLACVAVIVVLVRTERLARQQAQFATSAAHELRTPLAGLRLYGEMLADDLGDPARAKVYASRVADEVSRLARVVDNVLGASQLERGTLSITTTNHDLGALLTDEIERMRPALAVSGATLHLDIPDGSWVARVDRDGVARVLRNLVDNAQKYGSGAADRIIDIALRRSTASIEVCVMDRGPGVPATFKNKLFLAFARPDREDAPAGLGLGLALAHGIARAHGGDLSYEARPGGGATFVFSIPTLRDEAD